MNQIFFGPPGTGKTYNTINEAVKIVENLTDEQLSKKYKSRTDLTEVFKSYMKKEGEPQIAFCTFHQSFSYEDFVEGIKPVEPKKGDPYLKYEIQDGVFKKMVEAAEKQENSGKRFVLVIDEINRGNISQIFGELITLIEKDKRQGESEELSVILPYSKKSFSVPPNLYIIGTMNTADRSIEALDTALRRRFAFREMLPKPELISTIQEFDNEWVYYSKDVSSNPDLEFSYDRKIEENQKVVNVRRILTVINQRIEKLLDKDHTIGHSYLMKIEKHEDLVAAFRDKIIPLLEEYFYGDYGKIGLILGEKFVELKYSEKVTLAHYNEKYIEKDIQDDLNTRKVFRITDPKSWDMDAFSSIYYNDRQKQEN